MTILILTLGELRVLYIIVTVQSAIRKPIEVTVEKLP